MTAGTIPVLVVDGPGRDDTLASLVVAGARDVRVVAVVDGRSRASFAEAVGQVGTEHFLLVHAGDVVLSGGLEALVSAAPGADLVYADARRAGRAQLRPVWSPERLRAHQHLGQTFLLRTELVVTALPDVADSHAWVHDLLLRLAEVGPRAVHVPVEVVEEADRPTDAATWSDGRAAVARHLRRSGVAASVLRGRSAGTYRVVRSSPPTGRVSVVIPTRGGSGIIWGQPRCFVVDAVASVLARGGLPDVEVVVVHDLETPQRVLEDLRRVAGDRLVLVPFDGPFNFSRKCNVGVLAASGDVVVLLNDDVEVLSTDALVDLVAPLDEPGIGMTGACLIYPDGRVQHAGHLHGHGAMTHAFLGAAITPDGLPVELHVDREVSGLTAAAVAVRRSTYEAVGGMCETLPVNFNDVDFSHKLRSQGLRLLWLADVRLYHFESRTRVPVVHPWEVRAVRARWDLDGDDPYLPGHLAAEADEDA